MKEAWFYQKGNQKEGPVAQRDLQQLLDDNTIDATTLVWSESLDDWTALSKVACFHCAGSDLTLDPHLIPIESSTNRVEKKDDCASTPRQWVRCWARMIDCLLFFLCIGLATGYIELLVDLVDPDTTGKFTALLDGFFDSRFATIISLFLWIFVEAALLATWGTTPGKYLLRTKVRDADMKKLSFSQALKRSFLVWWLGMGAGVIPLPTLIIAAIKLKKKGNTSWDTKHHCQVTHRKIGWLRILIAMSIFAGGILLNVLGNEA